MSLWKIALRNLLQRKLSSILTSASVALGVSVVVAVLSLKAASLEAFRQNAMSYDLVVGAKGSSLQLVLNTLYHLDELSATIPWSRYQELVRHKAVKRAVPLSVGDQAGGFRIVATTDDFFAGLPLAGRPFKFSAEQLEHAMGGHAGGHDHGGVFEAVAGATAARTLGLAIGGSFLASHGLADGGETHQEKWTVVGLLKPSGTPNDRAIFINLDSFYGIRGHRAVPRISAVLLQARGEIARDRLRFELAESADAMAVIPSAVIFDLFQLIGKGDRLLLAVAILVIVVGAISILVAITNSMAERRRPIAIMRALGARRATVLSIVILEAATLCLLGGVGGLVLGHLMTAAAGGALSAYTGMAVPPLAFQAQELAVLGGVILLGILAGIVPALRAYRMDIADGLSPTS